MALGALVPTDALVGSDDMLRLPIYASDCRVASWLRARPRPRTWELADAVAVVAVTRDVVWVEFQGLCGTGPFAARWP